MSDRRRWPALAAAAAILLVACGGGNTEPVRYYDPFGYFSARLPGGNDLQSIPPQPGAAQPELLSGVVSEPVPPSAPVAGAPIGDQAAGDTTVFRLFAFDASAIPTLDEFAFLHTRTPGTDIKVRRAITVGGLDGVLIVADHAEESGQEFGAASAFAKSGQVGFWIVALFETGGWDDQRPRFFDILRSFRVGVPPGLQGIPA
jgi:hypothetical protein